MDVTETRLAVQAASNSFRVRDPQALREQLEPHGIAVTSLTGRRVRLTFPDGLTCPTIDPISGEQTVLDLPSLIAAQLDTGEVVVLKEISSGDRDVGGTSIAFNHEGATVTVDLEQITWAATELARPSRPVAARIIDGTPTESAALPRDQSEQRRRDIAHERQDAARAA